MEEDKVPGDQFPNVLNKAFDKLKVIPSTEIFEDAKMVIIQHDDVLYRLMITRQGKLILTK